MNTNYFMDVLMGNIFHTNTSIPIPTQYYLGLSSTAPAVDGSNVTEPNTSGSAYTRILLSGLGEPENGVITNTTALPFPESTSDWGIMSHYVIYDNITGGNLLMFGELERTRTVEEDTIVSIKAGKLTLQLSNPET